MIMKITPEFKQDISIAVARDFGQRDHKTDTLIQLITNKVLNMLDDNYCIFSKDELVKRFEILRRTSWLNPSFMIGYDEEGNVVQNGVTAAELVENAMLR